MDTGTLVLALAGLGLLVTGSELLVRGASRLAAALGISPLVIGLTVVAFGTSAPELAVSLKAAVTGQADIALGNVVGSNLFNVLFILGLSAVVTPLVIRQQLIRIDVPIMIGVSVLALLLARDGRIGRPDGLLLASGLAGYTLLAIRLGRREGAEVAAEYAREYDRPARRARDAVLNVGFVALGLAALVLGSRWLVTGAVAAATALGVDELVVALTVVAAGTSLPEVATSVTAAARGERDIAVGNVVGSNIFNLLGVLGLSAAVAPEGLPVAPAALRFDLPVMLAVAVACLPVCFTGARIVRAEGLLLLAAYAAYTVYLILHATDHHLLPRYSAALAWFALPLAAAGLLLSVALAVRESRAGRR